MNLCLRSIHDNHSNFQSLRSKDVSFLAVCVADQCDVSSSVRIVLDTNNSCRDSIFSSLDTIMADAATRGMAIIRIRHRPPDGRATRTLTLDKGRLTEREMTDPAAQDANAVPDGADENEETQA